MANLVKSRRSLAGVILVLVSALTLLSAQTDRRGSVNPTGTEVCAGANWCQTTVTLTDTQIKALPTTAVSLVAAPGTGKRVRPQAMTLISDFSAGAYTNINAVYEDCHLLEGASYINIGGPFNDNTTTPALTAATGFFGGASKQVIDIPSLFLQAIGGSTGSAWYVTTTGAVPQSDVGNAPLQIVMDNNSAGNLTGGNAANTLKIVIYYAVETF